MQLDDFVAQESRRPCVVRVNLTEQEREALGEHADRHEISLSGLARAALRHANLLEPLDGTTTRRTGTRVNAPVGTQAGSRGRTNALAIDIDALLGTEEDEEE